MGSSREEMSHEDRREHVLWVRGVNTSHFFQLLSRCVEAVPHMWKNRNGTIRVGLMHVLRDEADAVALDWRARPPLIYGPASENAVRRDFRKLATSGNPGQMRLGQPWKRQGSLTLVRLTDAGLQRSVELDQQAVLERCVSHYGELFHRWPAGAQLATMLVVHLEYPCILGDYCDPKYTGDVPLSAFWDIVAKGLPRYPSPIRGELRHCLVAASRPRFGLVPPEEAKERVAAASEATP